MVGQGVVLECIRDPEVERVVLVGRSRSPVDDSKVEQHVLSDITALSGLRDELSSIDACFWCLGVTSTGLDEEAYRRVTLDLTVAVARQLVEFNPGMTFVLISGVGADSTERGRLMWARVKGATENAILALPFANAYAVRPSFIQPLDGIKSRTPMYNLFYTLAGPIFPLLHRLMPQRLTTTRELGKAMLALARRGSEKRVLAPSDMNRLVKSAREIHG